MKTTYPLLSVIIPVFNEAKRIKNLSVVINFLSAKKFSWELLIIDDGSTDSTLKKLLYIKEASSIDILSYKPNRGKGYAIKQGMLHSKGRHKLFLDIDLSTPIEQIDNLINYLNKHDVIIGSRRVKGAEFVTRQNYIRESMGRVFTKLSQLITGVPVSDFTCGFKCFSKKAAQEIFTKQLINRWGFDPEILFIAKIAGFSIKEIPVAWKNDSGTRVRFPQDIITSLFDLLRIRANFLLKKYN